MTWFAILTVGLIVARCLAFRPEDRFSSAEEIIGRLDGRDRRKWLAWIPAAAAVLAGALWLGHESEDTTQMYLHADLALKEKALSKTAPLGTRSGRYRPDDRLLAFLKSL